jgi:hypothetical protein
MVTYKPKNEGLKKLIKSKLQEVLISEQKTSNSQLHYRVDPKTNPSDYLGRQGAMGRRYSDEKKTNVLKNQPINIEKLRQQYSCLPSVNQQKKPIDQKLRDSLLITLKWVKDNEDRVTRIFGVSKDTLYFLFKLAMTAAHTHSDWGLARDETRNRQVASSSDIFGNFGDWILQNTYGKSPSTGLYQMQAPVYRSMKGTHKLTGKEDIENIWKDQISSTLAAMEYFLTLYRKAKLNGKSGPSVARNGKTLPESTGDYAWDIAITGYQWDIDNLLVKYCKTKNQDGTYNIDYLGPCNEKTITPFKNKESAERSGKKYAGVLNVQQNEQVPNFLPQKYVSGTSYSTYDLLKVTKQLIEKMSCI